ncbi:GHKL domain-containing protein [Clostridium botulinum]|nr:GHKL domain-containing protein [Clostridium botulinum]NFR15909.1 GHKL domain-containing protein [Clostridium botulinum]NFR45120.1 GHKL domain-containing protein [Clostridium botulinum]NFS52016.1 GHKL domain-containing protein [Clostridium botulinum]
MNIGKDFIITFIELSAFMTLWGKFILEKEKKLVKNLIIILISGFIMVITTNMKIYYNMIFSYTILIFLVAYFYHKKFIHVILEFCLILILIMLLQLIVIFSLNFFNLNNYLEPFLFDIITNFIILIISICIYNLIPKKINILKVNSNVTYYFIINFSAYIITFKILWEYNKSIVLNNVFLIIFIQTILLILNIILYQYIFKLNEEKKYMLIQNMYNPVIVNIIEEVKSKQHDFKNHLNTINGILDTTDKDNLRNYLKEYIYTLNCSTKSLDDILYINDPIVGAIIYNKLCKAKKNNIKFLYFVNTDLKELRFKSYELSEILNNLLDNAFEAVENSINKKVILNITFENNNNILEIKNEGIPINITNISKIFKRGFSTKKGNNRGYGLYNVKKIVEQNGADIQLFFEDNYTIFRILF